MNNTSPQKESKPKPQKESKPKPQKGKAKKGIGFAPVLAMSVLAAAGGAVGGAALSPMFYNDVGTDNSVITQSISDLQEDNKKLKAQINRLETSLGSSEPLTQTVDLTPLENRLSVLENREPVSVDGAGISADLLSRLELLETEKAVPTNSVDLSVIEDRLTKLEAVEPPNIEPVDLSGLEARIEKTEALVQDQSRVASIEKRVAALAMSIKKVEIEQAKEPLPAFPRSAVLEAISTAAEEQKSGWINRALGKHISVQDEAVLTVLDHIDSLIAEDDLTAAMNMVLKLPESGQTAAEEWLNAAQTRLGETQ